LEYLPLPGGDAAIHNPWRIAVAYLHALLPSEDYPCGMFCSGDAMMVRQQVEHQINTPYTSSMGRLFDAVSALLGICEKTSYEAQAAIELQQAAEAHTLSPGYRTDNVSLYPFAIDVTAPVKQLRVAELFEALLSEIENQVPIEEIAARFHFTVAEMIVQLCDSIKEETGIHTAALSGGVFQNALLVQALVPRLQARGLRVLIHRQVPCNDGGVSLGQAVMAGVAAASGKIK
jgi:hydrogenase maturation protein HypF